jgi:tetratricopeptide (TPR) repeat protein
MAIGGITMKKWILLLLTVMILSACTPKAYTESMEAGKAALEKENYTEAKDKFENALEEKETNEAKNYLHAAESMQESVTLYHKGDFDTATYTLKKLLSKKQSKKLISKQANALIKDIQEAKALADSMKERIIKGKTLMDQNQYDQALDVFKEVSETIQFTDIPSIEEITKEASELMIETANKKKTADEEKQKLEETKQKEEEKAKAKQEQEEANQPLTHAQAEDLVKQHLNLSSDQNVKVVYDHDADNGDYIIHVYEFVVDNSQTGEGHTTTLGWYGVNKQTKMVYDAMQ